MTGVEVRTIPARLPEGWISPIPAWQADLAGSTTIAYYGVQSRIGPHTEGIAEFRAWITERVAAIDGPDLTEWGQFTDTDGYYTWIATAYWTESSSRFAAWLEAPEHDKFWNDPERLTGDSGFFREILTLPRERVESIVSQPEIEAGVAGATLTREGPIEHHLYWGSMRDRLPVASNDPLHPDEGSAASGSAERRGPGQRIHLAGTSNLAVIRSGQHMNGMEGAEEAYYQTKILPALTAGMDYLRDHPVETGCFSCRFMEETDADGTALERTFGLAHFVSLRHLEDWAEHHPTHLRIFNTFIKMGQRLGGGIRLRLWHEVAVPTTAGQVYEYVNCHPLTGLLPHLED